MKLPDCSNMMRVGQLRHIQSVYETTEYRNPDNLVRHFLTTAQRRICQVRALLQMPQFRSDPFYTYLIARTKYYDELFLKSIFSDFKVILNIGCGSDTRAFRFSHLLKSKVVRVLECDQPEAIMNKQSVARKKWSVDHVSFLSLDINRYYWNELDRWLEENPTGCAFVLMEGVSPYIGNDAFGKFLDYLSKRLSAGSRFVYDYKLQGVADHFGNSPASGELFRLSENKEDVIAYHRGHGFRMDRMELSSDLTMRLLPGMRERHAGVFREDCLLQLAVEPRGVEGR